MSGSRSSPSASGASTSGVKDDNMDGGRDKMRESVGTQNERSQQKDVTALVELSASCQHLSRRLALFA